MKKQMMTETTPVREQPFRCPNCKFAEGKICGTCGHRDKSDDWCREHGGYVFFEKYACASYV